VSWGDEKERTNLHVSLAVVGLGFCNAISWLCLPSKTSVKWLSLCFLEVLPFLFDGNYLVEICRSALPLNIIYSLVRYLTAAPTHSLLSYFITSFVPLISLLHFSWLFPYQLCSFN
jgi:hypothetical protein